MKKFKVLSFVLIVIVVCLGVLLYLSMTGKLFQVNCSCPDCKVDYTLDKSKLIISSNNI